MTQPKLKPSTSLRGWLIVVACLFAQVSASGLATRSFPLFLTDWSRDLSTPVSFLQLGLAGDGIMCALLAPFIGSLVDRSSPRRLLIVGVIGVAIFHFGISAMTAPWHYLVLYGIWLPASVLLATALPVNAIVSRWFVKHRGLALGITSSGQSAAGIFLPSILTATMVGVGWRTIWLVAAVMIATIVLPLVIFIVRDRPPGEPEVLAHTPAFGPPSSGAELAWLDILLNRNFALLSVGYISMMILHGGYASNLTPLIQGRGIDPAAASIILAGISLSQLTWTLLAGVLSDRFGNRLPLATFAFLSAIGGFVVGHGSGFSVLLAGTILIGFAQSFWPLLTSALANEFGARGLGRAYGLMTSFLLLTALAPFTVAKLQEVSGSYALPLDGMAVFVLIGSVALFLMNERASLAGDDRSAVVLDGGH